MCIRDSARAASAASIYFINVCLLISKYEANLLYVVPVSYTHLDVYKRQAFGQGNTTITPLHIAMMAQAIANDGVMLQPQIVKSIQSDGRTLYRSSKNSLSTVSYTHL